MEEIIGRLIAQKREGRYWDFKEYWHKNKAELLHDIICLANSSQYEGPRYLIFGISDEFTVKGIELDPNRRKQCDLLDWLNKIKFAGDIRPDVELNVLTIKNHQIDVLVIADLKCKPYFLSEKYKDGEKALGVGTIYSRVGDKNTAIDRTADLYDVEHMWRQRFGLELSPLERLRLFLLDIYNWESDGIDSAYYKLAPEFTLWYSSEKHNVCDRWWGNFLGEAKKFHIVHRYHTTTLKSVSCCHFERENLIIPIPEVDYVCIDHRNTKEANNTYSLFYFLQDSFEFSLLCYLFGSAHLTDTKERNQEKLLVKYAIVSPVKTSMKSLPFMIFKNSNDKNNFIDYIEKNIEDFFSQYSITPAMKLGEDKLKEEKLFAYWAYELFFTDKSTEHS